jgi:hypothetical protein
MRSLHHAPPSPTMSQHTPPPLHPSATAIVRLTSVWPQLCVQEPFLVRALPDCVPARPVVPSVATLNRPGGCMHVPHHTCCTHCMPSPLHCSTPLAAFRRHCDPPRTALTSLTAYYASPLARSLPSRHGMPRLLACSDERRLPHLTASSPSLHAPPLTATLAVCAP